MPKYKNKCKVKRGRALKNYWQLRNQQSSQLQDQELQLLPESYDQSSMAVDEEAVQIMPEVSSKSENEIKVFCPKCDTEVSHTAEGIQEDQTKILIAKVYHYFEQEYEELKTIYGDLDLTPLSKFHQRTALATGVSETAVLQILQEEEGRNADKRQEPPEERRRAPKRSIQTDSSSEEDTPEDNADADEQSSNSHKAETLIVKVEPPEYYKQQTEGESSTAAASSSVRLTEDLDECCLFGGTEIKAEEIEIHEEEIC